MKLLQWIKSLFANNAINYHNWHVEAYVASKKPTSTAEVEYWIRHFEQQYLHKGWAQ